MTSVRVSDERTLRCTEGSKSSLPPWSTGDEEFLEVYKNIRINFYYDKRICIYDVIKGKFLIKFLYNNILVLLLLYREGDSRPLLHGNSLMNFHGIKRFALEICLL